MEGAGSLSLGGSEQPAHAPARLASGSWSALRNDPGQCHCRAEAVLSGLMGNLFSWRRTSGSAAPARTD